MQANQCRLFNFLHNVPQFKVPIYQRTYSWKKKECRKFFDDVLNAGGGESVSTYFIGSIVHIAEKHSTPSNPAPNLIIDGQQRLTTVMLILEALARQLGDEGLIQDVSAEELRNSYLVNKYKSGEQYYKLLLTQTDKKSLCALMGQKERPINYSFQIEENFESITKWIGELDANELNKLYWGLGKVIIVDISLQRGEDNPQRIFESMNSTGRELSQADLIRNFVLMNLDIDQQTSLYQEHWRPMEELFGQEAYQAHFDYFVRHYLTYKTREIPNIREVYDAFKCYAEQPEVEHGEVGDLVADIHTFSKYYCAMALGQEPDKELSEAFSDLQDYKTEVVYPFLLELYQDYSEGVLSKEDFETIIRLVEAYVFRRAVCDIPTNSLNKTFATFGRTIRKDNYLQSIKAHMLTLSSYRRFPDNAEFQRALQRRNLYNFKRCSYWLRRLENYGRKERIGVEEYTIEHILPQNKNLSTKWQNDLGDNWKDVQEKYLHTLGNLTLTGYNSEYSDRPFHEKRDMEGGFKDSPLNLNRDLRERESWNEDAIEARAKKLAELAVNVWAAPDLPEEVLREYTLDVEEVSSYSIADYPNLATNSPMRKLFDDFRKEVLALDECVVEEFLKHYISYKAESNFVDVEPRKDWLLLTLNMRFHDLHDPRDLAKDVTNIGHLGQGDVQVYLDSPDDVPYVLGLVRQSLETQMGNDD